MKKFFTLKVLALTVSMLFIGTNNILAEDDKQVQVTIPATGHVAIRPERNFKGPEGLVVSNFYGSANATSPGLKFVNKELGAGVVIAHAANSSTGLILTGQPGTYTITYTDDAGTQNFTSTSSYWTEEAIATTTKNGTRIYKFVNTSERIGFERDESFKSSNYQSCNMGEGEHLYVALGENPLKRIVDTMSTTIDDLDFIPWSEVWGCPMVTAAGISDITSANATPEVIYNMQGVRLNKLQRGLNIVNGRIVVIK